MIPRLLNTAATTIGIINTFVLLNSLVTAAEWNVARFGLGPDLVKYASEPNDGPGETTTPAAGASRIILPRDADETPKPPEKIGNGGPLPDPTKIADPSLQTIKLPQPGYRDLITTAKTGVPPPVPTTAPTEAPPPGEEATTASSSSTIMDMAGESPQSDAPAAEATTAAAPAGAEGAAETTSAPEGEKPEAKGEAAKLGGPKEGEATEATTAAATAAAAEAPTEAAPTAAPEATEAAPAEATTAAAAEAPATEAPTEAPPEPTEAAKDEGGGEEATTAAAEAKAEETTPAAEGGETAVIESPEGAEAIVKALSEAIESKKLLVQNITVVLPNYNPPPQVLFDSIINGRPLQPSQSPYSQGQANGGNLRYGPPPTNLFYADRASGVGPLAPAYPARGAFDAGGGANRNFYGPCRLFVRPALG